MGEVVMLNVIKFVDQDTTLAYILQTNRSARKALSKACYKQALMRASPERLKVKRIYLWMKILDIDLVTYEADYKAHKALA